ncbi:MAG: recombination protein RecR [Deltaproteobacteria bacterium]|nr:recombination protein RecR [Deltaproteobacteria bacterium]
MASPLDQVIHCLSQLPGIGEKTASRLAFYILKKDPGFAKTFSHALSSLHGSLKFCELCQDLSATSPCELCRNPRRDRRLLLVVQSPQDMRAIEKSGSYFGLYHILHGVLSPLEGVGPEDLKLNELLKRLEQSEIQEIILGTNPNVEGEATALYLSKLLTPLSFKVSRLASGMPVGSGIEYLDPLTLRKALEDRRSL